MNQVSPKDSNGQDKSEGIGPGAAGMPMHVHAQYIKDLSFENPGAPHSIRSGGQGGGQDGNQAPSIDVAVNMDARDLEDPNTNALYEVTLQLSATAKRGESVVFIAEVEYGVTVSMPRVPKEKRHPMLMIEVPRLAFPFARQILADLTQAGGFPPLMLQPVDFHALYLQQFTEQEPQHKAAQ